LGKRKEIERKRKGEVRRGEKGGKGKGRERGKKDCVPQLFILQFNH